MVTWSKHHLPIHLTVSSSHDSSLFEPFTWSEPLTIPAWAAAMSEEFRALQRQKTWVLVSPPSHKHVIGCKWVFCLKKNSDGSVACHKARLVAKGYL